MKTKHFFVPVLDVGELLPFVVKQKKELKDQLKEQEKARVELEKFIDNLEKNFKEPIWYMGTDIIEAKTYERFIFEKGGFLEIMIEAPVAINAHFVQVKKAEEFCKALKKTLSEVMTKNHINKMFIDSLEVQKEEEESLTYKKWSDIKEIRNL